MMSGGLIYGEYKVKAMESRDTQSFGAYHSWEVDQRVYIGRGRLNCSSRKTVD